MSRGKDRRSFETNREYGYGAPTPSTPEFEDFKNYDLSPELLNMSQQASFDAARRGIVEGTSSPYSGINPVLRARLQQLGLQEVGAKEAAASADADMAREQTILNQKWLAASYAKPPLLETKTSGYGQETQQSAGSQLLGGGIQAGLMGLAMF